jgi:hypothetical protein
MRCIPNSSGSCSCSCWDCPLAFREILFDGVGAMQEAQQTRVYHGISQAFRNPLARKTIF